MVQILLGALVAFLLSYFIMPFVIRIAQEKKLYDIPDERKSHRLPIPSLGGIGIFTGMVISLLLVNNFAATAPEFQFYIAAVFILFIFGVLDDIFILSASKKLIGQLLVAAILTVKGNVLITNLHGFLDVAQLSTAASYIITFFTILLIINSFNLIDGIDGLAASLGIVTSVIFSVFLYLNNDGTDALFGFALAGALGAFLIFNFHPAKIFMGDSGSTLIGLSCAVLFIKFIENPVFKTPAQTSLIAIGIGLLLLPLMDVLRVFCIRLSKGLSPFAPDRNHLHHMLLNKGFSHKQVTFILVGICILFTALALVFANININITLFSFAGIFFIAVLILKYTPSKYKWLHVVRDHEVSDSNKNVKVVSIFPPDTAVADEE